MDQAQTQSSGMTGGDRRLIGAVLTGSGIYAIAYLAIYLGSSSGETGPLFSDFSAIWSFAKFALAGHAHEIYDVKLLTEYQTALTGGEPGYYPFPYPPIYLLYIWALGLLPYLAAYAVWVVFTLGLYLWMATGSIRPSWNAGALVLAPATLICAIFGQNGFLTAGLLIGGTRLLGTRPLVAGVLFGLLSYKPQFGVLVPVALVSAGRWTALVAAAATTSALVVASAGAFGWAIWARWLGYLPVYSGLSAIDANRAALAHLMPTLGFALGHIGIGVGFGRLLQAVLLVGLGVLVWWIFRRGIDALSCAALWLATFLGAPFGFVYDTPMVSAAIMVWVAALAAGAAAPLPGERILLISSWLLPIILIVPASASVALAPLVLTALLAMIAARRLWPSSDAIAPHLPGTSVSATVMRPTPSDWTSTATPRSGAAP